MYSPLPSRFRWRRSLIGLRVWMLRLLLALILGSGLRWVIQRASLPSDVTERPPIARAKTGAVLLVANRQEDTLTFVDVDTGQVLSTTNTGYHPHDIAVTPDGRTAFVANYGAGQSLSVIDVAARRELRKIDLGLGRDPLGIQVGRDGTKLYVTPEDAQEVLEVDLATEKVVRTLQAGQVVSRMFVLAPDGRRLYATNARNGMVSVVDLGQGAAVAQIAARPGCEGIDITPDGRTVWTANTYSNTITVIDTNTLTVVANLPCQGRRAA